MWLNWGKYMANENLYITSFFHGKPEDGEDVKIHIDLFLDSVKRLEKVSNCLDFNRRKIIGMGCTERKTCKNTFRGQY